MHAGSSEPSVVVPARIETTTIVEVCLTPLSYQDLVGKMITAATSCYGHIQASPIAADPSYPRPLVPRGAVTFCINIGTTIDPGNKGYGDEVLRQISDKLGAMWVRKSHEETRTIPERLVSADPAM